MVLQAPLQIIGLVAVDNVPLACGAVAKANSRILSDFAFSCHAYAVCTA